MSGRAGERCRALCTDRCDPRGGSGRIRCGGHRPSGAGRRWRQGGRSLLHRVIDSSGIDHLGLDDRGHDHRWRRWLRSGRRYGACHRPVGRCGVRERLIRLRQGQRHELGDHDHGLLRHGDRHRHRGDGWGGRGRERRGHLSGRRHRARPPRPGRVGDRGTAATPRAQGGDLALEAVRELRVPLGVLVRCRELRLELSDARGEHVRGGKLRAQRLRLARRPLGTLARRLELRVDREVLRPPPSCGAHGAHGIPDRHAGDEAEHEGQEQVHAAALQVPRHRGARSVR